MPAASTAFWLTSGAEEIDSIIDQGKPLPRSSSAPRHTTAKSAPVQLLISVALDNLSLLRQVWLTMVAECWVWAWGMRVARPAANDTCKQIAIPHIITRPTCIRAELYCLMVPGRDSSRRYSALSADRGSAGLFSALALGYGIAI